MVHTLYGVYAPLLNDYGFNHNGNESRNGHYKRRRPPKRAKPAGIYPTAPPIAVLISVSSINLGNALRLALFISSLFISRILL